MNPKKTALVLIEYQNDFVSEGGTLHAAVKPVMDETNMLANTVETVAKARELGATIIFAPITFTDDNFSSSARMPARTSVWSSARMTVMGLSGGFMRFWILPTMSAISMETRH